MSNIIITTPDQLQLLIEQSFRKLFAEQNLNPKPEQNELLGFDEAAKFLGIAKQTLYGYTSKRLITFIKRGGKKILFRRSDLNAYLQEGKKPSITEIHNNLNKD